MVEVGIVLVLGVLGWLWSHHARAVERRKHLSPDSTEYWLKKGWRQS